MVASVTYEIMKRMVDVPGVARGPLCTHIMKYNALKMYKVDLNNVKNMIELVAN
jgi:hypothetical protein